MEDIMANASQPISLLVMAAGTGSRYGGLKQVEPLGPQGETLIDFSLRDALAAGFTRAVFIVRKAIYDEVAQKIASRWQGRLAIAWVFQEIVTCLPEGITLPPAREKPWGTGHAILAAREAITTPFAIINGDDYYGPNSMKLAAQFLRTASAQDKRFALISFPLNRTFSPSGGAVSRGVCVVGKHNMLQEIQEYRALLCKDGKVYSDGKEQKNMRTDTPVSMNLWGFTPPLFGWLEREFHAFLKNPGHDLSKAEFMLPETIQRSLQAHAFSVQVISSQDQWLGITYRADVTWAKQQLEKT
jgi:hypothetical protein